MENKNTIKGVENSFRIIQTIYGRNGATAAEIADELGFSRSTVHNHLNTLVKRGLVTTANGEYDIGLRFLMYGGKVRDEIEMFQKCKPIVDSLAEETGEFALLTTKMQYEIMTIYTKSGAQQFTLDFHLGKCLPLHCTAPGKAILANFDTDTLDDLFEEIPLESFTENTLVDPWELLEEIEAIRERGVAFNDEERIAGTRGVASSIVHRETGDVLGAIGVVGPANRINGSAFNEELPNLVRRHADQIEVSISFS